MTSRETQPEVKAENININYAAQSTKDISEESVDDILASVDQFIEGVYRDLKLIPPKRSSVRNSTTSRTIIDEESSSSSQTSSPVDVSNLSSASTLKSGSTSVISPSIRRNMDTEIEKINRICDNVDQNLRSIGLIMNNNSADSNSKDLLNTNQRSSSSSSTSIIFLNCDIPNVETKYNIQNNPSQIRTSSPIRQVSAQVIDLTDLQTQTPECVRQPVRQNDNDDDDVILVSADIPSVVNLCSPDNHQEMALASFSTSYQPLNRQRLLDNYEPDVVDTCCEGPSSTSRPPNEPFFTISPQNKTSVSVKQNLGKSVTNDAVQEMPPFSSSTSYQPLNRRRLHDNYDSNVVDTCCEGPSSTRRPSNEPFFTISPQNKSSVKPNLGKSVTNDAVQEMPQASSSTSYQTINRRSLLDSYDSNVVDTFFEGPSSTRRRRIEPSFAIPTQNKSSVKSNLVKPVTNDAGQQTPLASSSTNYRSLNRHLFDHYFPHLVDTVFEGISSTRKRRIKPSSTKSSQKKSAEKPDLGKSVRTDAAGPTPYMCPVCMESCLQRQPTSTICGHVFCKECVECAISVTNKCPMCNKKITKRQTFRIYL